jgi:hypothetical protein
MNEEEIQQFAEENKFDVRKFEGSHYRLFSSTGERILDVYIKHKKGRIVQNTILQWKTNKWLVVHTLEELNKLI